MLVIDGTHVVELIDARNTKLKIDIFSFNPYRRNFDMNKEQDKVVNKAKQMEEEQIMDTMCQQLQMEVNASETQKYYKSKEVQDLDNPTDVVDEYEPRKSISERYSMENMAKRRGMTVEKFKIEIDKQLKMQQDIIDKQLSKGWTQEQAETHALRCLYIDGFSGPTFKD